MNLLPLLFIFLSFTVPQKVQTTTISQKPIEVAPTATELVAKLPQDESLDAWIGKLAQCESGGNWKALNPKDLDGTPSKGKFQFKDTTFDYFSGIYKIATTTIWNGDEQELILREMVKDPTVDLHHQFPECTRRLGLPPQVD